MDTETPKTARNRKTHIDNYLRPGLDAKETEFEQHEGTITAGGNCKQKRRGRKPATESRAAEIRAKLLERKQMPEPHRPSLRVLAIELGVSHQLLSFHLRRLAEWQRREYGKKAREIADAAYAEGRSLTEWEERQRKAYESASFNCAIGAVMEKALRGLKKQIGKGALSQVQVKLVKLLASKGFDGAQEILNAHYQRRNNLPPPSAPRAKSFKPDGTKAGNSAKGVSRAFP
jgi:hypothetical protein